MTYFSPSPSARRGGRKDDSGGTGGAGGAEGPGGTAGEPRRNGTGGGGSPGRFRYPAGSAEPTGPAPDREAQLSVGDPRTADLYGTDPTDPTGEALVARGPEARAGRGPGDAEPPRAVPADPASRRAVPPASRPASPTPYRPDDPPGDLAGLFPSRATGRTEPDEPTVIDLTYHERPVAAPDDPQNPQPIPEHAVPPGFPVELPQPSLRREQLLLTAVSWLIVLFTTLLGALGGLTYSSVKSATYTATSSVIVTTAKGAPLQSDPAVFAINYAHVVTSSFVLAPALADAGISMSADEASKHLTVSVPSGSSLITIEATANSGADAAALANAAANGIATYGSAQAPKTGYDASIFTPATAPSSASRPDRVLNVLVGALIGLVVGGGVVLVIRRSRRVSAAAAG